MSRVITYSRQYPSYHNRKGEPTYFVEKIWNSFHVDCLGERFFLPFEDDLLKLNKEKPFNTIYSFCKSISINRSQFLPKYHTIRAGKRWKVGDWFSPRIWSGKPYKSKMVVIGPDFQIKKIWDFDIVDHEYLLNGKKLNLKELEVIAGNDGLTVDDLELWFAPYKEFSGQVICWNDKIEY